MTKRSLESQDGGGKDSGPEDRSTTEALQSLVALHDGCTRQLNQLCVQVQERGRQSFADYRRALSEAQLNLQSQYENVRRRYATAMAQVQSQPGSPDVNKINEDCKKAARDAEDAVQSAVDKAGKDYSSAVSGSVEDANRQWDTALAEYLRALKEAAAKVDPESADPTLLAAFGQSFTWVSQRFHKRAANGGSP
jgi:hypothetical protein